MTTATFFCDELSKLTLTGFLVTGHTANDKDTEAKIICAGISSALYMTANTITDVIGAKCYLNSFDGFMELKLLDSITLSQDVLIGLKLHLNEMAKDYPFHIKVTE